MNNVASILVLIFLALTFLQSGYDKLFHWKDNVGWLTGHFANTILKNQVNAEKYYDHRGGQTPIC